MQAPIRAATEELELTVRRLTVAYQRGLEDAYLKYARTMQEVFEGEQPIDLLAQQQSVIGSAPVVLPTIRAPNPTAGSVAVGDPPPNEEK